MVHFHTNILREILYTYDKKTFVVHMYIKAIWYIYCYFGIFIVILVDLWPFGIYCGHCGIFMANLYILWSFGIYCGHFYCAFPHFGFLYQKKSGNPGSMPSRHLTLCSFSRQDVDSLALCRPRILFQTVRPRSRFYETQFWTKVFGQI
jgi:hypothetical protein